ncbi:MAG: glutathione S-transferase family protein [Acetobacterales bacterium]
MRLIGRHRSPYVRRVATTMRLLGMSYEHVALSPSKDPDKLKRWNPVLMVPALELDDGEVLIDSAAIIDHLDEIAGERALTPQGGAERRAVNKAVALALNALFKGIELHHEIGQKPADKRHQPWMERCTEKMLAGFGTLDAMAAQGEWLAAGRLTQADVTTVCAFDFCDIDFPEMPLRSEFPNLDSLSARCNALSAFAETTPEPV